MTATLQADRERELFEAWWAQHRHDTFKRGKEGSAWELWQAAFTAARSQPSSLPSGWVAVPIEPTESMESYGFEAWPDEHFSAPEEWAEYEALTGCQQAAYRARVCYKAMMSAAPPLPVEAAKDVPIRTEYVQCCRNPNCPWCRGHGGYHRLLEPTAVQAVEKVAGDHYERRIEILCIERDVERKKSDYFLKILLGIFALLPPQDIEVEGRTMRFNDPKANDTLHELRRRIYAISDEVKVAGHGDGG